MKYKPLDGSSYIKLPDTLAKKKAIAILENEDYECFKWVVTRAMNPVEKKFSKNHQKLEKAGK